MALGWRLPALLLLSCLLTPQPAPMATTQPRDEVPRWGRVERSFTSATSPANPFQDLALRVTFTAPSRATHTVDGFWDGGAAWRVRFSPDELGAWTYTTRAVPETDGGLHGRTGAFRVVAATGQTRFDRHGPIRVSSSRTYLEHADGTPFFWLADTGWNAALHATTTTSGSTTSANAPARASRRCSG